MHPLLTPKLQRWEPTESEQTKNRTLSVATSIGQINHTLPGLTKENRFPFSHTFPYPNHKILEETKIDEVRLEQPVEAIPLHLSGGHPLPTAALSVLGDRGASKAEVQVTHIIVEWGAQGDSKMPISHYCPLSVSGKCPS